MTSSPQPHPQPRHDDSQDLFGPRPAPSPMVPALIAPLRPTPSPSSPLPADDPFLFRTLPSLIKDADDVNALLRHIISVGGYDATIQPGDYVKAEIGGLLRPVTTRRLSQGDLERILIALYRGQANVTGILAERSALNVGHEHSGDGGRDDRCRWRVNLRNITVRGARGQQVSMRFLPRRIKTLAEQRIEPELIAAFRGAFGLVVVAGRTNSGKSTLLAGVNRMHLEEPGCGKLCTLEDPIEFILDGLERNDSSVSQAEVGEAGDYRTFAAGVREFWRINPRKALVGETRDRETADALLDLSLGGPDIILTTLHAPRVAEIPQRLLSFFPDDLRTERGYAFMAMANLLVVQTLVQKAVPPDAPPERIALREWLVIDESLRGRLLDAKLHEWPVLMRRLVNDHGRPMATSARLAHAQGLIADDTLARFLRADAATSDLIPGAAP